MIPLRRALDPELLADIQDLLDLLDRFVENEIQPLEPEDDIERSGRTDPAGRSGSDTRIGRARNRAQT